MKHLLIAGCFVAVLFATAAGAGEWSEFAKLDPQKQLDTANRRTSKSGEYIVCKLGKYEVFAEDPLSAYKWAMILFNFSESMLEEGIVPKAQKITGKPQVFVRSTKEGYHASLREYGTRAPEWSVGLFYSYGSKAALFGYDYAAARDTGDGDNEEKRKDRDVLLSTMLHECTHQMVYYHIGYDVPLWFNEGLATNMETYDMAMNMKANLYNAMYKNNRADGAVIFLEEGKLKSFRQVFTISSAQWSAAQGDDVHSNYITSWAACNFFFTTKRGRKFVGDMIKQMCSGGTAAVNKMFTQKNLDDIDGLIREHIKTVILPACKFGRPIRKVINEGDFETAAKYVEKMKEEFPESNEMKFYAAWLDIVNENDPKTAVKVVQDMLDKTDFFHPEANYVLALGYFAAGDNIKGAKALKDAQKNNSNHQPTSELAASRSGRAGK